MQPLFYPSSTVTSDVTPRSETDLSEEFSSRAAEVSWLSKTGRDLSPRVDEDSDRVDTEGKRAEAEKKWKDLNTLWESRARRQEESKEAGRRLKKDLAKLRAWIKEVEAKVGRPVSVLDTSEREYQKKRKEYRELAKRIAKKTPAASGLFNECEMFLSAEPPHFDPEYSALRSAHQSLSKRWSAVCARASQRGEEVEALWTDWNAFLGSYGELVGWISGRRAVVARVEADAESAAPPSEVQALETELEAVSAQVDERLPELDALNDRYCDLAREYRLDASDDLKTKFISVNNDWEELTTELDAVLKRLRGARADFLSFRSLYDKEMNWLRECDARVTEVEFDSQMDFGMRKERLEAAEADLRARQQRLDGVSEACRKTQGAEELAREFVDLRADVTSRLEKLLEDIQKEAERLQQSPDQEETMEQLPPISVNTSGVQVTDEWSVLLVDIYF